MFSGRKDTDFIILSKLDDRDLISVCLTNKYVNGLCKSEDFWRNRFISKWGKEDMKYKSGNRSWKSFYLLIVKYFLNDSYDWGLGMFGAAREGHIDLVKLFISKNANLLNTGMYGAAEGGHRELVNFFIEKGVREWDVGMFYAALGGHKDLIELFISKGADIWNIGMRGAAEGGHRDLVDFFISKGANDWNKGIHYATKGGHRDLVDFFTKKLVNNFKQKFL